MGNHSEPIFSSLETSGKQSPFCSQKRYLSSIDLGTCGEPGCAPDFDQGLKVSSKVPFITFEQLGKELQGYYSKSLQLCNKPFDYKIAYSLNSPVPSDKAQTDCRNIILEIHFCNEFRKQVFT